MEAAASVVGIVSFGLSLAKTLQAFIDSVIEAEETITLIVADVNATASTLKRLQDFIDEDKTTSQEEHRATVFNATGIQEIGACALQCQKIYFQIIFLIEKASMQAGEDGSKNIGSQSTPAAEDPDAPAIRLAVFSKNVTKLGRKMRWPWLEPRIKRCQEHLGRLKVSLMLSLQVFFIAESRARPSVARVFGTDEEGDLRDRAEMLRKKMTELRAKKSSPKQSSRQPPGSDDGASEVIIVSSNSNVSTTSVNSSTTTGSRGSASYAASSSLDSEQGHRSRRLRGSRKFRVARALHAFKVHLRKRMERKAVFKKDLTSVVYEAHLIYPFPGPLPGGTSPPPSMKLPFGHRRLTREVKRALRKCNPWEILLILSPPHRLLVDKIVQQVQLAATEMSSVCLVAIDVDGLSDVDISDLDPGDLVWTRMVLFFHHEIVRARKEPIRKRTGVTRGEPRFGATIHNIFSSGKRKSKKELKLQARLKEEEDEKRRDEAKTKEDREKIEKDKADLEEAKRILESQRIQIEEEKNNVENTHRKIKEAEEAALKEIEKGSSEGELKKILEEERAKMKASEEKAAAEKAKAPLKFRDAVGRKFSFPFHLVQTWQGMEDLIKQAFIHVDVIGPHVQEGHYDLISSEGEIILPPLWSATIKPGDTVSMRMWPEKEAPRPPQPSFPSPGRPMQGMAPPTDYNHTLGRMPGGMPPPTPYPSGMPPPLRFGGGHAAPMRPPGMASRPPPLPPGFGIVDGGRSKKRKTRRAKKTLGFFGGPKPSKKSGKGKHQHHKHKTAEEESENTDEGDDVEDIDKELGLDDLEGAEQVAAKDVDELLETWTNVGGET